MSKRTTVKKVTCWAVIVPGAKKPIAVRKTRKAARALQRTYERMVSALEKRA